MSTIFEIQPPPRDSLARRYTTDDPRGDRVFNETEARRIVDELVSYTRPDGALFIQVTSWWTAGVRWARNSPILTADRRDVTLRVGRNLYDPYDGPKMEIAGTTNQTDSVSLRGIAKYVDYHAQRWRSKVPPDRQIDVPRSENPGIEVWSDHTFNRSVVDNATAVEALTRISEAEQLMSAGYIETAGHTALRYYRDLWGRTRYEWGHVTQAQCSATVRHPKGDGSGWAGKYSFEINRVNITDVARLAFEKCKKSLHPVRIEPGRYQTILEPAATGLLMSMLLAYFSRLAPESWGMGPMYFGSDRSIHRNFSKLGLKILDERINIYTDPIDPIIGTHPSFLANRFDWIKNGVLTDLVASYDHNLHEQSVVRPVYSSSSYMMSGGPTSFEEMISSTKRGLLVSRLVQPRVIDADSMLYTGLTRDGLWLIENGVITKAVKNFRWTESPLFALNNVEQIGMPEQILAEIILPGGGTAIMDVAWAFGSTFANSLSNVVAPPIKVNDFSFTSTVDAL